MRNFLISIFLIAALNSILEFFLPWFILAFVAFGIGYISRLSNIKSFLSGFIGIGLSWFILICIRDQSNHHILSTRLANLFQLHGNYWLLILVNVLLGSIIGGLSALCGRWFNANK